MATGLRHARWRMFAAKASAASFTPRSPRQHVERGVLVGQGGEHARGCSGAAFENRARRARRRRGARIGGGFGAAASWRSAARAGRCRFAQASKAKRAWRQFGPASELDESRHGVGVFHRPARRSRRRGVVRVGRARRRGGSVGGRRTLRSGAASSRAASARTRARVVEEAALFERAGLIGLAAIAGEAHEQASRGGWSSAGRRPGRSVRSTGRCRRAGLCFRRRAARAWRRRARGRWP